MLFISRFFSRQLAVVGFFVFIQIYSCVAQDHMADMNKSSRKKFELAGKLLSRGETEKALEVYEGLYKKYPNNPDLIVQLAIAHLDMRAEQEAMLYLQLLVDRKYEKNPLVYSTLGDLHHKRKEFEQAIFCYEKYIALMPSQSFQVKKAEEILKNLRFAQSVLNTPYDIQVFPLDKSINTSYSEYLPQFTLDEENLVFTRRLHGQEDLFFGLKTDSTYLISPLGEINTRLNEGAHTLSSDGRYLVFTHCNEKFGYGGCDLYSVEKSGDSWSRPRNMGSRLNTRGWESQPSLSADGRALYFSSDREGSFGGRDLWVSFILEDGTWGVPANLGPRINTKGHDESPFIHADNKTLYFRSTGHPGLGGYDIFLSRLDSGLWQNPVHLGAPINSTTNDGAMVVSLDGSKGYYASDSYQNQKQDNLDIFAFSMPELFRPSPMTYVKGRIVNDSDGFPLPARVTVTDLSSGNVLVQQKANFNGEFLFAVPVHQKLAINIHHENFIFHSAHVSYDSVRHGVRPFVQNISLTPIIPFLVNKDTLESSPIVLNNIFFETGRAILLEESLVEINYLYQLLIDHPEVRILISGHTDNVGSELDNQLLSQARAEVVKDALIAKGIAKSRVETAGFGESQPVSSNESPEGRAKNRRTEFTIIR